MNDQNASRPRTFEQRLWVGGFVMTAEVVPPLSCDAGDLVRKAAQTGARLLSAFEAMAERYELVKSARGEGLMIGIEFGAPRSLKLKASWALV